MIPLLNRLFEITNDVNFKSTKWYINMPFITANSTSYERDYLIPRGTILLSGHIDSSRATLILKILKKYNPDFKIKYPKLSIKFNSGHIDFNTYNKYVEQNLRELTKDEYDKMAR